MEVTATNVGATPAPFGYAAHPYLTVGESRVDDVDLTLPAATYLEVDERVSRSGSPPSTGCRRTAATVGRWETAASTRRSPISLVTPTVAGG